jgi:hypothetical protein
VYCHDPPELGGEDDGGIAPLPHLPPPRGGIIDRDGGGLLSPSAVALLLRGFVCNASTEEGTTIARMDLDVETDARSYVTLILCQMAEKASN